MSLSSLQDIEPRSEESADEVSGFLGHQASDVICFALTFAYMFLTVCSFDENQTALTFFS